MKIKVAVCILIISVILFIIILQVGMYNINIDEIDQKNSIVNVTGEKVLILKERQDEIKLPHLNMKGIVTNIEAENITITLSDYAKSYLETDTVIIDDNEVHLNDNDKIFIKFNDISIKEKELRYNSIEIYKYVDSIEKYDEYNDYFTCDNDFGGEMKVEGISFKYKGNTYFKSNYNLVENNEEYYINVKNGNLLVEDLKSNIFPYKIYNMINPQETHYYDIIEIYRNRRSK